MFDWSYYVIQVGSLQSQVLNGTKDRGGFAVAGSRPYAASKDSDISHQDFLHSLWKVAIVPDVNSTRCQFVLTLFLRGMEVLS